MPDFNTCEREWISPDIMLFFEAVAASGAELAATDSEMRPTPTEVGRSAGVVVAGCVEVTT